MFRNRKVSSCLGSSTAKALDTDGSRYTFAWIRPLLEQARKSGGLEYDDLSALGHAARSQDLNTAFQSEEITNRPLWRIIVSQHFACLFWQWTVAILESIASVIPAVCMWKILSILEDPTPLRPTTIWLWVVCLAGSKACGGMFVSVVLPKSMLTHVQHTCGIRCTRDPTTIE